MAGPGRIAAAFGALIARRWRRGRDAAAARRACAFAPARPLRRAIEPLAIGDAEAAHRLASGRAAMGGASARIGPGGPWAVTPPSEAWRDALHGFGWLDDAVAAGRRDRRVLLGWAFDWIARYGGGGGPGWKPHLAGRRLARLVVDGPAILKGATARERRRFERALGGHLSYLRARGRTAPDPLARIEAAVGLLLGELATDRRLRRAGRAAAGVGRAASELVRIDGGTVSRDPEELGRAFVLLAWAAHALGEVGLEADARHAAALKRAGPALRALRLGGGGLARFHGGGAMDDGALDQAFALAGAAGRGTRRDAAMGYLRMQAGGVALVIDAAPPPPGPRASASSLAFEMSVGRRRLVGGIGPGAGLAGDWPVAARATAAHAAVEVAGLSSARLAPPGFASRVLGRPLVSGPSAVSADRTEDEGGQWLLVEHDGYLARLGLMTARRLNLAPDGATVSGEDTLTAPTATARARFDAAARDGGLPFVARFHLHPDIAAERALDGRGARLSPPSGPAWVFRASGGTVALEDSVSLEGPDRGPRKAAQIVVSARAEAYFGRISWTFHRERAAPAAAG